MENFLERAKISSQKKCDLQTIFINESGLYSLIFIIKKLIAKEFK
jgi:prophage antirepressor-like protein